MPPHKWERYKAFQERVQQRWHPYPPQAAPPRYGKGKGKGRGWVWMG